QRSRIVPQMSQNVPVAASAQEPSDALSTRLGTRAARVVVVDRELPACAVRPAADVALAALGLVDRPVLLVRDAVGLFDVCLVRCAGVGSGGLRRGAARPVPALPPASSWARTCSLCRALPLSAASSVVACLRLCGRSVPRRLLRLGCG